MQTEVVQFLAALANEQSRERFARITLHAGESLPIDERADRLLINSGVLRVEEGRVQLDSSQLGALLDHVRASGRAEQNEQIGRLPRRQSERVELLTRIAGSVLQPGERIGEAELGERLEPLVADVAAIRRAMIDYGVLDRNSGTQMYWLRGE